MKRHWLAWVRIQTMPAVCRTRPHLHGEAGHSALSALWIRSRLQLFQGTKERTNLNQPTLVTIILSI